MLAMSLTSRMTGQVRAFMSCSLLDRDWPLERQVKDAEHEVEDEGQDLCDESGDEGNHGEPPTVCICGGTAPS